MTMGPGLKKFLKKHGRFPKGPKERKEAGTMTKKDKARARNKSGSKKKSSGSKKKKSTKSKSKKSTKSKSKSNGGKKMSKSRFKPFNNNGIKVVTCGALLTLSALVFTGRRHGDPSPWDYIKKKDPESALRKVYQNITTPGTLTQTFAFGTALVGGGARMMDVKSISFVQFS